MKLDSKHYLNFKVPATLKKYIEERAEFFGMSLASYIRFLIVQDKRKNNK